MEPLNELVRRLLGVDGDSFRYSTQTRRLELAARSAFIDEAILGLRRAVVDSNPGGRIAELRTRIAAREAEFLATGGPKADEVDPPSGGTPDARAGRHQSPERRAMERYRDAKDADFAREVERLRWASADAVERRVDDLVKMKLEEVAAERNDITAERQQLRDDREVLLAEQQAVTHDRAAAARLFEAGMALRNDAKRMTDEALAGARQVVADVLSRRELVRDAEARREWPRPQPQPYGVSHDGAELLGRDWLRFLGITDAETTRASGDGGVDVIASTHVAQVKNYAGSVGAEAVRQLAGVAMVERKSAVFLTSGSYTREGILFGSRAEMALFTYDATRGVLVPMTREAEKLLSEADPDGLALESALDEAAGLLSLLDGAPSDV